MKQVTGYLTDDGKFFTSGFDAALHEATEKLLGRVSTLFNASGTIMAVDDFQRLIDRLTPQLEAYLHAKADQAANKVPSEIRNTPRQPAASVDKTDYTGGEDFAESLHELSTDRRVDVSHVGGGTPLEEIQYGRASHGLGGREDNARGFRRGPPLATGKAK